jgi:hypothetical protein
VARYNIGDRVAQPQYGAGTVTAVNEFHTIIEFDEHGVRTFSTNRVQLHRSDSVAPIRPAARTRKTAVRRQSPR